MNTPKIIDVQFNTADSTAQIVANKSDYAPDQDRLKRQRLIAGKTLFNVQLADDIVKESDEVDREIAAEDVIRDLFDGKATFTETEPDTTKIVKMEVIEVCPGKFCIWVNWIGMEIVEDDEPEEESRPSSGSASLSGKAPTARSTGLTSCKNRVNPVMLGRVDKDCPVGIH
jgi:hypothetical protein